MRPSYVAFAADGIQITLCLMHGSDFTDFRAAVHEYWTMTSRILGGVWLTDIGSRALAARLS